MAVIRRSFTTLNKHNFVPLYKALVRSHLDYAISIWSPYKQKYKDAIENVQRRATKQLPGMKNIPYEERLQRLKLPTLAYRRTRGDMIEVYKLLHGKYDSDVSNIIKLHKDSDTREGTRGHSLKLFIDKLFMFIACTNVRKESFSLRVTRLWNDLPEVVVTAPSVNSLKHRLDRHCSTEEFLYNYKAALPGSRRAFQGKVKDLTTEEATAYGQEEPQ